MMYPHRHRKRPVPEVAAEYASFKGRVIIFWDDNIAGDLAYAKDLFHAITPYRKWWSSQASIHAARDEGFLDAAAKSGCKQLFLGLESISQQSMIAVKKGFNRVDEYSRLIERIHSYGIAVQAGIVFGFDHDTPAIFTDTLDFLEAAGVHPEWTTCCFLRGGTELAALLLANPLEGGKFARMQMVKPVGVAGIFFYLPCR